MNGSLRRVLFRFRCPPHQLPAEVRGDFIHFYHPIELAPAADGSQQAELRLPDGIYEYKFRTADGAWHLDPDNARTRSFAGLRNSLLSLGGTEEPVLHAPALPFIFLRDDGLLTVRAGLRRGADGERLTLRFYEAGPVDTPMRLIAREDEHLLFEARVPASLRVFEYLFVLASGRCVGAAGSPGQALCVETGALRADTPAWWKEAVLYTLFVDRFRRGGDAAWPGPAPSIEEARRGGDLRGVIDALPYLADLGISALHLTPVVTSPSAHRYDAVDPRQVDPALGGEEALSALLDAAHRLSLRVLLDLPLTHVHRDFAPFRDVRERGERSPYLPWFRVRRLPILDGPDPGYEHYQKGRWQEPLLDLGCEEAAEYVVGTFRHFARLGADGFRVDAAADVPLGLIGRLRQAVRAERPDAVLFGEVIPDNIHRYTGAGLDAATDFSVRHALHGWLIARSMDARELARALRRRVLCRGPGHSAIVFAGTHDQHRVLSLCRDARRARLMHLCLLTRPEVPALYYGDEIGLSCDEPLRDFEDVWPDRQPFPWEPARWDKETRSLVQAALRLRRERRALSTGDDELLDVAAGVLAYRRTSAEDLIEVYLNGEEAEVLFPLAADAPAGAEVLLALGEASVVGGEVRLGPYAGVVVRRHLLPELADLWRDIVRDNRALSDRCFQAGLVSVPGLPAQLYLTVTEACNLRCRHCITEAPALTRAGRARTMRPWLLHALREALSAADYFAFAHGGEALTAPIFMELLAAIRQARAGRPYDVHLLSNGMLLNPARLGRLIDLGVTSLAVSLDGASAASNDAIREGARFETIVGNLRAALRLRRERGADLRIGISTVVARDNLAELGALGRLCVELGVDWLKVEEMFPANGFARHQLVAPDDGALRDAVATLGALLGAHGIVLVDHLAPPAGCPCDGAHALNLRRFREADDFANRARFRPCSMAFEQACVDPDGTVRPIDPFHPPLGNLSAASFFDLWNGAFMQRLRAEALARVPRDQRLRCPRS